MRKPSAEEARKVFMDIINAAVKRMKEVYGSPEEIVKAGEGMIKTAKEENDGELELFALCLCAVYNYAAMCDAEIRDIRDN